MRDLIKHMRKNGQHRAEVLYILLPDAAFIMSTCAVISMYRTNMRGIQTWLLPLSSYVDLHKLSKIFKADFFKWENHGPYLKSFLRIIK